MKARYQKFLNYFLDRLNEPSTWQGIGFIVALTGSKLGLGLDWGQAAGLGGTISAAVKMFFPDTSKQSDEK